MENLEISAKTVGEATKRALVELKVGLDEVEITVLNEGKNGILGIGAEDARISVKLRKPKTDINDEVIQIAKKILEDLLHKMGFEATINIGSIPIIEEDKSGSQPVIFNIAGNDLSPLIGRRGQILDALQYLVRLMVSKKTTSKTPVMIDVENYKQHRYEDIRVLALNVAEQVKAKNSSIRLEPMAPFERRIVHLTLANDKDIITESIGEGDFRKVVVMPKSKS